MRALYLLITVRASLRRLGFRRTRDALAGRSLPRLKGPATGDIGERAAEVAGIVARAARLAPLRIDCLTRSLALWELLREEGIESRPCFGARRDRDALLAHCWLEIDGRVLNDDPDIALRFPPLLASRGTVATVALDGDSPDRGNRRARGRVG